MKKLILCDMDGTLLNSKKELPIKFDKVVKELYKQDCALGIASGRQFFRLRKQFSDYDDMLIIAENGASVYKGDECLFYHPLDEKLIVKVTSDLMEKFEYSLVYSGLKGSYVHKRISEQAYANTKIYCENLFFFDSIDEVLKKDKIVKMAFYIKDKNADVIFKEFKDYYEMANVAVSAKEWIDINDLGVSKGEALKKLKELYSLKDEDCYAFGDYDNDIELLKEAYHSYAMENAVDKVKEAANFICPSNDDDGVMKTIIKEFNLDL